MQDLYSDVLILARLTLADRQEWQVESTCELPPTSGEEEGRKRTLQEENKQKDSRKGLKRRGDGGEG